MHFQVIKDIMYQNSSMCKPFLLSIYNIVLPHRDKMPTYKLTYFDVRGRAEMTRMAFVAAGVEFEDCRVTDWATLKPSK